MTTEHQEQQAIFDWAEWQQNNTPELALLHAIPNGQYRKGQRPEPGLKSGVPDMFLPVCRDGWAGLYIELKVGKNKPSDNQSWWIEQLRQQGYHVVVCYGFEEAKPVIEQYLDIR